MNNITRSRTALKRSVFLAFALPLLLLSVYVHYVTAGNAGAKLWLLYAARMMLGGKKLYVDIFEVNPPFIVWFDAMPVWISEHQPFVGDAGALVLMGLMTVALCVWLCVWLLSRHPAFADDVWKRRWFALLLSFVLIFFTTPVYFFDREHIMLLMILPYIVRFMPSLARTHFPRPASLLVGVMAALGFCTKPHTAIVFIVLQGIYIVRERSAAILWSMENILIYIGTSIYLLCAWHFAREYFTVVMPMAMLTYHMYSRPKVDGLYYILPAALILALTFVEFRRNDSPYRRDIPYLLGVCVAFLLYALANNGWGYTFNPLICSTLIVCGWVWMEYLYLKATHAERGLPAKQFVFGARSCAIVFGLGVAFFGLFFFSYFFTFDCSKDEKCDGKAGFLAQARQYPKHSFGATPLDPNEWTQLSLITHTSWDTRFNAIFMLPAFMMGSKEFNEKEHWVLDYVSKAYAEDLDNRKPDTMFIDMSPDLFSNFGNPGLVNFLSFTPEFRKAWSHYKQVATIDTCHGPKPGEPKESARKTDCRFAVYQRID